MRPGWLANAALVAASTLIALLVGEFGYRLYLSYEDGQRFTPQREFFVYDSSIWEFDREIGYRYRPHSVMNWAFLRDGVPQRCGSFTTGEFGSPGAGATITDIKDAELIVLGDSFTAFVHDRMTWPDLFAEKLQADFGDVDVVNLSMDGYGILQMAHQAAQLVRNGARPKAIVIAVIGPDLIRFRTWRVTVSAPDGDDLYTSYLPSEVVTPLTHRPSLYVHRAVTPQWCESNLRAAQADPIGLTIAQGHDAELKQSAEFYGTRVRLLSLTDCYICNLVLRGQPRETEPGAFPLIGIERYEDDPGFKRDMDEIEAAGVPLILVYLAWEPELRSGEKQLTREERALLESLERAVDYSIDTTPSLGIGDAATALTLLPEDAHPSYAGIEYYADEVHIRGAGIWESLFGSGSP